MPKGFHNSKFYDINGKQLNLKCNGGHNGEIYGSMELKVSNKLFGFLAKHKAIHEHKVNGKTSKGSKTVAFQFWTDWLLPLKRIDLEADPKFHTTYKPVAIRDKKRDKLLKENLGITTIRIGELDLTVDGIANLKEKINAMPTSKQCLDYYFKEKG